MVQKRHQSLFSFLFMLPPGWIFHFGLQPKAIVEEKQEKKKCIE